MDEPLMHKTPNSDFERLVWERHMNKLMSKELAVQKQENLSLKSKMTELERENKQEMKELLDRMKKDQVGVLVAKNKRLSNDNHAKDIKLRTLKKEKDELMTSLIRIQQEKALLLKDNVDECAG